MRVSRRLIGLVVIGAFGWWWLGPKATTLPSSVAVVEVVDDLTTRFAGAVGDPVRVGELQPGSYLRAGGVRPALLVEPRARVRVAVAVPQNAALRFAVGVAGRGRREARASGVRFRVRVDGDEVWTRVVNPAATRTDRRWFDEAVVLDAFAGRTIDLTLETEAVREGVPLAGTPGWSRVRLVQRTMHARQPATAGPNVLVLVVDTLRADRLGVYGAVPSPSPTLDALATGGLVFERASAQSSWTPPSVASIMTGVEPRGHGVFAEVGGGGVLTDAFTTWAEVAARAGITTVGVSANPLVSEATNLTQGFETFVELPWDAERRTWADAARVNDAFLVWLEEHRGVRFVGYLHYMEPHEPYGAALAVRPAPPPGVRPAVAEGRVRQLARKVNRGQAAPLSAPELGYVRRLYDADVQAWDGALARLLAGLDRAGVRESTLVLVTADHGEEFQEHGRLNHGSHLYDESLHVPLVLVGPGIPAGRRTDEVQGIDVLPTVLHLLGSPPPEGLRGRNISTPGRPPRVVSETTCGIGPEGAPMRLVALRDSGWKLIHAPALGRFELYDLARDPGEQVDRWGADGPGATLVATLAAWEAAQPPLPVAGAPDATVRERLRALGYVE